MLLIKWKRWKEIGEIKKRYIFLTLMLKNLVSHRGEGEYKCQTQQIYEKTFAL